MKVEKLYVYTLITESGDAYSDICGEEMDAIEFMKEHASDEYSCWIDEGYEDDEIPFNDFIEKEITIDDLQKVIDLVRAKTKEDSKIECSNCNGRGLVQIGENIRGLEKCPACQGTGFVYLSNKGV